MLKFRDTCSRAVFPDLVLGPLASGSAKGNSGIDNLEVQENERTKVYSFSLSNPGRKEYSKTIRMAVTHGETQPI